MKKTSSFRSGLIASIAAVMLMICSSASAKNSAHQLSAFDLDIFPLKMPTYSELIKYDRATRDRILKHWQEFLVTLDDQARSKSDYQALQYLYDLWLSSAEAGRRATQPYCINQGVVKPLAECDTKLGAHMHDFDTNEKLSKLGPASQCSGGGKPCSPFFGFTAEGQMFCSSMNLTRDCAAQSEAAPGKISLSAVLQSCAAGSPGNAKVDCKALMDFVNEQAEAANTLCKNSPKRYACSILKSQIELERTAYQAAAQGAGGDRGNPAAVPAAADAAAREVAQIGPKPDCPDRPTVPNGAQRPAPAQNTQRAPNDRGSASRPELTIPNNCVKKPTPTSAKDATFEALYNGIKSDVKEGTCNQIEISDQIKIDFVGKKEGIMLLIERGPGVTPLPIPIGTILDTILDTASQQTLAANPSIDSKSLLASYVPKDILTDSFKFKASPDEKSPEKEIEAKTGWVTPNGTKIRFAMEQNSAGGVLHIVTQKPGKTEAEVESYRLSREPASK